MTLRLYCDEDSMRQALVVGLRKRGVDILTSLEAGTTKETDEQQLAFAAAQGRAIYSSRSAIGVIARSAVRLKRLMPKWRTDRTGAVARRESDSRGDGGTENLHRGIS